MKKDKGDKMPGKPFATITDLLGDLLSSHIDKESLAKILNDTDQGLEILKQLQAGAIAILLDAAVANQRRQEVMADDLLSIKAFLSIPDARLGATTEQLQAISDAAAALAKDRAELASAVEQPK